MGKYNYTHPQKPTPDTYLQLGWDAANQTYFAHVLRESDDEPEWSIGDFFREILTVKSLFAQIQRYIPQFQALDFAEKLKEDKAEKPAISRTAAMQEFIDFFRAASAWDYPFCAYCGEPDEDGHDCGIKED